MLTKAKRRHELQAGLVLVELLITALILVVVLGGLLQLFIYCQKMAAVAGQLTMAVSEAQAEMEEIRNHNFGDIVTDYSAEGTPGDTFDLVQVTGTGRIYIDETVPGELLEVEIVVSWQTMDGRIIGEDRDLDGQLGAGEDINPANGQLDSPTSLISLIAQR